MIRDFFAELEEDESKILEYDGVILSGPGSPQRDEFRDPDRPISLPSSVKEKVLFVIKILPHIRRVQKAQKQSVISLEQNPENPKTIASDDFLHDLELTATEMGASAIGYATVSEDEIFTQKGILYKNAIVLTAPMDREKINTAPGFDSSETSFASYAMLGEIVNQVAGHLRAHGFGAQADPALGGKVSFPDLAENATIGLRGRHGLLISPENGPCQRIAAVYTSITNLPTSSENPHLWIRDFCRTCGECAKHCPGGAINLGYEPGPEGRRPFIDAKKCHPYFEEYHGCGVCIRVCPFHMQGYEMVRAKVKKS
ncbi:ferredoxin [Methanofollis sp. W23]|uniref:4Fe-4S dicluster domain-containing protein n=1 Tax=Methanofollis sp. W23 TaxID=2817849 RepID=UPI001AE620C6|nr:4Fe-4S dicluster domain-containing protein [Methanofollis sp. W23]MBP2145437.1 ferredoxin [Methanofollis sp. W23]